MDKIYIKTIDKKLLFNFLWKRSRNISWSEYKNRIIGLL